MLYPGYPLATLKLHRAIYIYVYILYIYSQPVEDFFTLKLDQSNGHIIEFPLTGVTKVYRITKKDEAVGDFFFDTSFTNAPLICIMPLLKGE